jgi:hypothetical protein
LPLPPEPTRRRSAPPPGATTKRSGLRRSIRAKARRAPSGRRPILLPALTRFSGWRPP